MLGQVTYFTLLHPNLSVKLLSQHLPPNVFESRQSGINTDIMGNTNCAEINYRTIILYLSVDANLNLHT